MRELAGSLATKQMLAVVSAENGAGEGIRTLDPHVGNVMLYP
jgi:hypothetical protein